MCFYCDVFLLRRVSTATCFAAMCFAVMCFTAMCFTAMNRRRIPFPLLEELSSRSYDFYYLYRNGCVCIALCSSYVPHSGLNPALGVTEVTRVHVNSEMTPKRINPVYKCHIHTVRIACVHWSVSSPLNGQQLPGVPASLVVEAIRRQNFKPQRRTSRSEIYAEIRVWDSRATSGVDVGRGSNYTSSHIVMVNVMGGDAGAAPAHRRVIPPPYRFKKKKLLLLCCDYCSTHTLKVNQGKITQENI
ncbi:hypothetical protein Btru_055436 [Bulinus truncatus]|nr:hypothetical protein Btru_055436 [Bulinus truncatus]